MRRPPERQENCNGTEAYCPSCRGEVKRLNPVAQADLLVTDPLSHEGGIRSGFGDGLRMERNKGETSGKGGR